MLTTRQLVEKYDRPGPRYTSYPTAPLMRSEVGAQAHKAALAGCTNRQDPLSLYVHVPYCHSLCWYCGCTMKVSRDSDRKAAHLKTIFQEIDAVSTTMDGANRVYQIHLGGGTPNALSPEQIHDLILYLRNRFQVAEEAEISAELDPRLLSNEHIDAMLAAGMNRFSLGIQDFNPKVQEAIHRIQPREQVTAWIEAMRDRGCGALNFDLIYGLPHQTPDTFAQTLDEVIELNPQRLALFNFAYVPQLKPHMRLISKEALPTARQKMTMFTDAVARFEQAGYVFIGMDHFARPDDSLAEAFQTGTLHRSFQGYSLYPHLTMLGFGMSAISMFDDLYVQNHRTVADYEQVVTQGRLATQRGITLSDDDRFRRTIIERLMCTGVVDVEAIEAQLDGSFVTYFPGVEEQLGSMVDDGLLIREPGLFRVTRSGRLFLRNIAMVFDRYLPKMANAFSRTV